MKSKTQDPFTNLLLDSEEQAIEQAILNDEYHDTPNQQASKQLIEEAAKRHTELNTTKPITLRVKQTDLIKIKAKAKRSNIPYQTLLGAVLHDFAKSEKELSIK